MVCDGSLFQRNLVIKKEETTWSVAGFAHSTTTDGFVVFAELCLSGSIAHFRILCKKRNIEFF